MRTLAGARMPRAIAAFAPATAMTRSCAGASAIVLRDATLTLRAASIARSSPIASCTGALAAIVSFGSMMSDTPVGAAAARCVGASPRPSPSPAAPLALMKSRRLAPESR